jgi:SHS2 domain-containing protein
MAYGFAEHVGELELWIEAPTREAVFAESLQALAEVLGAGEEPAERSIRLEHDDPAVLFADWLAELAFLAETEGFVPAAVEELALEPGALHARVSGATGTPPHLVKAVTYHRLAFAPGDAGWRARAILDV